MRTRSSNTQPIVFQPAPFQERVANRITAGVDNFYPFQPDYVRNWGGSPVVVDVETESITDDVAPSKATKTVTHVKSKFKFFDYSNTVEYVTDPGNPANTGDKVGRTGPYVYHYSWGWYGNYPPFVEALSPLRVVYPKTVNELLLMAKHRFNSSNETDNLLNLVESSQLRSGVQGVFDFLRRAKKGRTTFGQKALAGSNAYLFYSFGIAPLIADMKKIDKGIRTLQSDLERLIRDYNKPISAAVRCTGTIELNPGFASSGYDPSQSTGWWHCRYYPTHTPTRIVGVKGLRTVEYQSDAFKKLHWFVSRYVATGPASFAWERLPYSFVVDWFVNLTGVIDAIDGAITGTTMKLTDSWKSEKWGYINQTIHHGTVPGWSTTENGRATSQTEASYYHRSYIDPTVFVGLNNRFGKKQASLLAALLHQYVANLRR